MESAHYVIKDTQGIIGPNLSFYEYLWIWFKNT